MPQHGRGKIEGSVTSMMIGAWLMLSAFFVAAVINDKLQWVSYLLGASVVIGLAISGTILTLP